MFYLYVCMFVSVHMSVQVPRKARVLCPLELEVQRVWVLGTELGSVG